MVGEPVKSPENSLLGLRVLVVEDEFYIADDLARALRAAGASVIGPCATVAQAEAAVVDSAFDFAILT